MKFKEKCLLSVLLIALMIRAVIPVAAFAATGSLSLSFHDADTIDYLNLAQSILTSSTFSNTEGNPEVFRTPGYPALLGLGLLVGHVEIATVIIQVVLSTLTVLLVFQMAFTVTGCREAALISALLYSFEPLSFTYASLLMSETLFTALMALFMYCFLRFLKSRSAGDLLFAAVALTASAYVRPIGYFLIWILALGLFIWVTAKVRPALYGLAIIALYLVISMPAIGAWNLRNYVQTGFGGFSTSGIWNLYSIYVPVWENIAQGKIIGSRRLPEKEWPIPPHEAPANYDVMKASIADCIMKHPWVVFSYGTKTAFRFFLYPGAERTIGLFGYRAPPLTIKDRTGKSFLEKRMIDLRDSPSFFLTDLMFGLFTATAMVLAAVGLVGARLYKETAGVFLLGIMLYFTITSVGPLNVYRFRHPVMPIVCTLAGTGLYLSIQRLVIRRRWKDTGETMSHSG
ncbi:MAG: glycosyltransferase family 39 protein [Desulfomonilaceae bacterium]|nr:glycosyltransferase family 39 protein [Desulfomonilaceae bacterium]